jgi:hypothetical protein
MVRGFLPDAQITFAEEGGREESGNYVVDWSRPAKKFGIEYPGLHTRVLEVINDVRRRKGSRSSRADRRPPPGGAARSRAAAAPRTPRPGSHVQQGGERPVRAPRALGGRKPGDLPAWASTASGTSAGSAATSSASGRTPSPGRSRPVRASRISADVSPGPGMSGPASQMWAYRSSPGSTCARCAGRPPKRLKCRASIYTGGRTLAHAAEVVARLAGGSSLGTCLVTAIITIDGDPETGRPR